MPQQKSVALLIETSNAYARNLLSGIVSYLHTQTSWSVSLPEQHRGADPPTWLRSWKGDGVIARIETESIAKVIRRLKVPIVDVSAARHVPSAPWVETDDSAMAEAAFQHFRERGFRQFAFLAEPEFTWSNLREAGFIKAAQASNFQCHVFHSRKPDTRNFSWAQERNRMGHWLRQLPRPVGIFACYDIKGQQVLDLCREQSISVPEEVAVLGVDNDELLCDLCNPPLSSIMPAAQQAGRQAAELLELMMDGQKVPPLPHLIKPLGIVTRQSTDVIAIDDQDVADAMKFIRDHACEGINVNTVLDTIPLSRRVLEKRFQEIIGRTPHQEIARRRLEQVRRLLIETDLTLRQIASKTGFRNEEYLSVAFRKATGISPGQYRKQT
ncbi:MAG: DNA-binding transcriptional regulator [Fuerstiella sp.]